MSSWEVWLKGLAAAAIGGASNAVTTMVVAPDQFNLHDGLDKLISVAVVSAIVSVAMYLKSSPLPGCGK